MKIKHYSHTGNKIMTFKTYLTTLIEEKGTDLHDEIGLDGHIGLTWAMLVDLNERVPSRHQNDACQN
jgi:hypothetical protein